MQQVLAATRKTMAWRLLLESSSKRSSKQLQLYQRLRLPYLLLPHGRPLGPLLSPTRRMHCSVSVLVLCGPASSLELASRPAPDCCCWGRTMRRRRRRRWQREHLQLLPSSHHQDEVLLLQLPARMLLVRANRRC